MKTASLAAASFALGLAAGYGLFHTAPPMVTLRHPVPVSTRPLDTVRVMIPVDYEHRTGAIHRARPGETIRNNESKHDAAAPDLDAIVATWLGDSIALDIPRTQAVYDAPAYTAWVSGVAPALDSLSIKVPPLARSSRWSVALQAGVGLTPAGPQPYIGLGLSFSLLRR